MNSYRQSILLRERENQFSLGIGSLIDYPTPSVRPKDMLIWAALNRLIILYIHTCILRYVTIIELRRDYELKGSEGDTGEVGRPKI